jgi:hypothetical protein
MKLPIVLNMHVFCVRIRVLYMQKVYYKRYSFTINGIVYYDKEV